MSEHPLAGWLAEEATGRNHEPPAEDGGARRHRPLRLLAVALAAWLAVVILAVALIPRHGPVTTPATTATRPPPETDPSPAARAVPTDAGAAAVLQVRRRISHSAGDGHAAYVDLALPVAATPVGDTMVVEVIALVLYGDESGWQQARVQRYAVPTRVDDAGRLSVGGLWSLPTGEPEDLELAWSQASARPEAVRAALATAGYARITDLRLTSSGALEGIVRATFRGISPHGPPAGSQEVWLRTEPTLHVVGTEP